MRNFMNCRQITFLSFALLQLSAGVLAFQTASYHARKSSFQRSPFAISKTTTTKTKTKHERCLTTELSMMLDETINILPTLFSSVITPYTDALYEHPLVTKSLTAGVLCGVGDVIAQSRDPNTGDEIDFQRLARFSFKGCLGGIIWSSYYSVSDSISESIVLQLREDVSMISRIIASILFEQFIFCPLIFSLWEIPVATLFNGAPIHKIPKEIKSELGGLLVSNAKVWTPANILIYSAPPEFRVGISNIIDIFWQSIVSEVAAKCGSTSQGATSIENAEVIMASESSNVFATSADDALEVALTASSISQEDSGSVRSKSNKRLTLATVSVD